MISDILNGIEIGIIGLSVLLFALSIIAFRSVRLYKILFASAAFILFAIQSFLEYQDDTLDFLPDIEADILLSGITLGILVLFFLAIARRK